MMINKLTIFNNRLIIVLLYAKYNIPIFNINKVYMNLNNIEPYISLI